MCPDSPRRLQREGVQLFGRVGAGLSHELSNVFNIINELAGLQQDVAAAAAVSGPEAGLARVAELAGRIKAQVNRGEAFDGILHHFAHSVDEPRSAFDLGEVLTLVGDLAARGARLARVELEVVAPGPPVTLTGDRFTLLMTTFHCVEQAVHDAGTGRHVELRAEGGESDVRVLVLSDDPVQHPLGPDGVAAHAVRLGCADWSARIGLEEGPDGRHHLVLTVPLESPPGEPRPAGEDEEP